MWEQIKIFSEASINPLLFKIGMSCIDVTGIILLIAVGLKFLEHKLHPQKLVKEDKHFYSTKEMTLNVLILFPFWTRSIGQFQINNEKIQYIFFIIGLIALFFAVIWHIWAKFNIGYNWSDDIEIKENHKLITNGAYALARHPMYASLLLWCWSASLSMFNYITLTIVTFIMFPLMIIRAKAEEKQLIQKIHDYLLYQRNVRMLVITTSGITSILIRIILVSILSYCLIIKAITFPVLILLVVLHLYFGYSFLPEKVAFSYRSKSGMILVFGLLGLYVWYPFFYFFYIIIAMCLYGLKWNCPCMLVYEKYHMCPCFVLLKRCIRKK